MLVPNLEHKLEVLEKHCKAVGRNYEEVGKSLFAVPSVYVTESEEELTALMNKLSKRRNMPIKKLRELFRRDAPGSWVGYPEEVLERFRFFTDLGFDYFQVMFPGVNDETLRASQKFAELVMKEMR